MEVFLVDLLISQTRKTRTKEVKRLLRVMWWVVADGIAWKRNCQPPITTLEGRSTEGIGLQFPRDLF